ncbi:hypothetical protein EON65_18485, partial [archaeon]
MARRMRVVKPDTPFFEISAPTTLADEPLKQSKIAPGMEICFVVTFKPQEIREYAWDLVCSTEREKFIVPLRAIGYRPLLTLPDEIDFGPCPIKAAAEKKITVQNIGSSVARFTMRSLSPQFTCPEQDIIIEAQATYGIILSFTPQSMASVDAELEVLFSTGVKCYILLKGFGKNVEVSLSTPSVTLEPSYISLFSQKTLKIRNHSSAPISYRWKSFLTEEEEESERNRLLVEINRIEEEERAILMQKIAEGYYDNMDDNDDDGLHAYASFEEDLEETSFSLPFAARVDEATIIRKYRNLRKALELDKMLFVDDIFDISPSEGEVWAHAETEVTIVFRPDTAALYNCLAFLDVSGRHDRLPLQLTGQGIGPHAALSFDVLDIGDVFVNDVSTYELSIKNKGDIPAQWTFMSSLTKFGNKFQFSPTDGYLLPNQSQNIAIRFESDILGEFSEFFRFALQGNENMLVCQIKGHVLGPTFHFDCNSVNFGTVSYDYLHTMQLQLFNTSTVPMVYNLHIPQDGTYLKREFNIQPSNGTLAPKESLEITLEFIPTTIKVYDYSLAVDVLGVGDTLLSIPISAECIISQVKVELPNRELDFGDCFIRYPYEQDLNITNLSSVVHTKFEVLPQLKQTMSVVSFETDPAVAVIAPSDTLTVKVRLIGIKLGSYKVPLTIAVAGSVEPPMQAVLAFNTVGPKVVVDSTELKWGNIECLKDAPKTLTLTNVGLISASMKIFTKMARSCFQIEVRELVLEAQQSHDLQIVANLDDSVVTKDEVHIFVDEGDSLMVPLVAKGIGTTMYCKHPINVMDLGVQLTNVYFEKSIVLENKGRRPQQLKWHNTTLEAENAARLAKAKKLGKDPNTKLPKHLAPAEPSFTVTPEEITLRSRTATMFTFRGYSAVPRNLSEMFVLESRVGKERQLKPIIESELRCQVVNPLLEFSTNTLAFEYTWQRNVEAELKKAPLILKNVSQLTLSFVLKTEVPFNLNMWELTLSPEQEAEIIVEFDPIYKDDRQSHIVEKTLQVNYRGHPQKDGITLKGEVVFPNLEFDLKTIQFGCVLNDTSKAIKMRAKNSCKIDVNYEWIFLEQSAPTKSTKQRAQPVLAAPPSHVFDILPVKSLISPGASEDVEFTLLNTTNSKITGTVICVVEGGPEYKFPISGESSNVGFELDKSIIDFGKVVFTTKSDQELVISNTGKVIFNYNLSPCTPEDAKFLEFIPPSGKVNANQQEKVIIRMKPSIPNYIKASFSVRIAQFDPVVVTCYVQGIFPTTFISLPRFRKIGPYGETEKVNSAMWEKFQAQVISNMFHPDPSLLLPVLKPTPAMGSTISPPSFHEKEIFPPRPGEELEQDMISLAPSLGAHQSLASSTKGILPITLDTEMQRDILCHLLNVKIAELPPSDNIMLQDLMAQYINLGDIVAGRYLCDFGNVIIGQTKKKIFKITNASLVGQLSWLFDKKYFSTSGFSVEPEKVQKLAEGASVDFTVKYFARTQQKIGVKTVTLPLQIQGSPTLHITFSANVCLPEIVLSSYSIDCSKVVLGQSARVYIGLHNPSPVPAIWSFKHIGGKDEARFVIEPSSGTLRPGKRTKVYIDFTPIEAKRCYAEFAVKVDQNKKSRSIKVYGEGMSLGLKIEPENVHISPVLPLTEGEEQVVTVQNTSDYPLEFFSVDFDTKYKEEEAILSVIEQYDAKGQLRTALRQPGFPLPPEIMEAYHIVQQNAAELEAEKIAAAAATAAAKPPAEIKEGESEGNNEGSVEASPLGNSPRQSKMDLKVPILRTKPSYRDRNQHQDILIVGPPLTGASTAAQYLSKKLLVNIKQFDAMLQEVAECNGEVGSWARELVGITSAEEGSQKKAKEAELLAAAEQSKLEVIDTFTKDKKNKGKEVPPELLNTPAVQAYQAYQAFLADMNVNTPEKIGKMLLFRATWADMGDGIIIDGINSSFVQPDVVIKALQIAFPGIVITSIKLSTNSLDGYCDWINHTLNLKLREQEHLMRSMEVSKRQLFKFTKAVKGKSLDDTIKELEASFAVSIPEELPSGEESWVDSATGQIVELESNDFKVLDDKEKALYLKQLLYAHSRTLQEVEQAIELLRKSKLFHNQLRTPKVESTEASSEEKQPNSAGEPEATFSERMQVVEKADDLQLMEDDLAKFSQVNFTVYTEKVLPALEAVPKIQEKKPDPVIDALGGEAPTESAPEAEHSSPVESTPPEDGTVVAPEAVESAPEQPPAPEGGLVDIVLEGEETLEDVQQLFTAFLPAPKVSTSEKENALPEKDIFQLYRRPANRPNRRAIKLFRIVDMNDIIIRKVEAPPVVVTEPVVDPKDKGKKGGKDAKPAKGTVEEPVVVEPVAPPPPPPAPTRWVIEPQGTVQFKVRFKSEKEGKFESTMEFEMVGTGQRFSLPCVGVCAYPSINTDTRNVFMRRLKALSQTNPHPIKRFVIAENFFSFGALSLFKKPEWKEPITDSSTEDEKANYKSIESTHSDVIRITNNGLYKREVSLQIEYAEEDPKDIYSADLAVMEVEEGETKEVRIWAQPKEEKGYKGTLVLSVKDNPTKTSYSLQCWGTNAMIDISGPWSEGLAKAEEAVAKNTDKKLAKELEAKLAALKEAFTIDFERVLLNKVETRSFKLTNTSLVPVAWTILPESFQDSPFISFSPASGEVAYNASVDITISFVSPDARLLSGNFSLKFADHEGGLDTARSVTKKFRIVSEAYSINAVSIKSDGQEATGSSEVDFGLVRVGDYATQTLKMGNKGKYKIGYAFNFTKTSIADLITISPMEGTIETGIALSEIKVTFCAKASEVHLKGNSEIMVQIKEPLTGEIVETFPLLISAQSKFNT